MHRSRRDPRSLALLTDLYQLTMACGYWRAGTPLLRARPGRGRHDLQRRTARADAHDRRPARRDPAEIALFHPGIKRLVHPHRYPVGLEQQLFELKTRLVLEARGRVTAARGR